MATASKIVLENPIAKIDVKLRRGSTLRETVTWKRGETLATATPVDLTGCSAVAQCRAKQDSEDVLFEIGTADSTIVLGGVLGTIEFVFDDRANDFIPETGKGGPWDVEITMADGSVWPFAVGVVTFSGETTRED